MSQLDQIRKAYTLIQEAEERVNEAEELLSVPDGMTCHPPPHADRIRTLRARAESALEEKENELYGEGDTP